MTDVLIVTPPRSASVQKMISRSYPGYPSVDSVPLRAAQVLEDGGFTVKFLPLYNLFDNYSLKEDEKDIRIYLKECEGEVILEINDYFIRSRSIPTYHPSLHVARLAKEQNPHCSVVLAGNLVSVLGREVFTDSPHVDVVILWEVELILCDLVEHLLSGKSLHEIKGILYRKNGHVEETGGYGVVEDLDGLPVPAYHLLLPWMEEIPRREGRASGAVDLTVRTSYGCPNRCAFCGGTPTWNFCRFRSASKVAEDLENAKGTLKGKKTSLSYFDDENITINNDHLTAISNMMQDKDMFVEGVLAGIPNLTKEVAQKISQFSGSILTGAENAVDSVLTTVNKPQTFDQVRRACRTAKESKLEVNLQWVIGLPGEDTRTMAVNLNAIFSMLMKGEANSISPNLLRPQPGSEIGEHPEKYGITIHHRNWSQYRSKGGYPCFSTKTLTREQIYAYYLMAELVAAEASKVRGVYESHQTEPVVWRPEIDLFSEFMNQVGSP